MRFALPSAVILLMGSASTVVVAVPAAVAGETLTTLERRYECSYQDDQCKVLCTGGSKYINCGQSECLGTVCKCVCHYG
ncbi:hypothetical protein JDV02_005516 [Purpureocillium takamizusanense]|uniref:Defensin n=1 Tax=Purpureocillium takamizusanense TaxID=2060973 RepID=A0A9Q8VAF0_9HYPO|nr:uncharacterized protein JDV02_005516 [Purpureocillium takamizusanense]UNI19325.1 hypothetical protein JDV02_005516 [Purpureocillium takamizusanense]